jgi:hypothetical protein
MSESTASPTTTGTPGKWIALAAIFVVVGANLLVPSVGTSLPVNLISAAVLVPLIAVVTRGNPRARVIALSVLGALVLLLLLLISFATWAL